MTEKIIQDNPQEPKDHTLKQCIHCKTDIPAEARICLNCNLSQGRWYWLRHAPYMISLVLMFVAIAQLLITYNQMNKAKEERIEAETIKKEVEKTRDNLREVVKTVVENEYILASSSFMAIGKSKHRDYLESNLDKLIIFVEPDEEKRDGFLEPVYKLFEGRRQNGK